MFHHDDTVSCVHQPVQGLEEQFDVCHGQSHGGFVEHVQGAAHGPARTAPGRRLDRAGLGQLRDQLYALGLAAGQRGGCLAQGEVTQPHILEQLQRMGNLRAGSEELHRIVDLHLQHVADALAAPQYLERGLLETTPAALVADDLDVRQKTHLDGLQALSFAARTTPAGGIEGETVGGKAAHLGFGGFGVALADGVPDTNVGSRAGTRRLADGGLVHLEHALERFPAADAAAALPLRGLGRHAWALARRLALRLGIAQRVAQVGQQHVTGQAGLAAARYAGHHDKTSQRNIDVHIAQVVQPGAPNGEHRRAAFDGPRRRETAACAAAQVLARDRGGAVDQVLHAALRHHPPTARAGAGADIDHMLGGAYGFFVVLHHDQRVAARFELVQGAQQYAVVAGVQTDGGLIEHIADALQVGAQLRGQPYALRLATRKRRGRAVEREVGQAHLHEEVQAAADFGDHVAGDLRGAALERQPRRPRLRLRDRHGAHVGDGFAVETHRQRSGVEALPLAFRAGGFLPFVPGVPPDFLAAVFGFKTRQLQARAKAMRAPAVLGVVGEHARIGLRERLAAARAGAMHGEDPTFQRRTVAALVDGRAQFLHGPRHLDHAVAVLQRCLHERAQGFLVFRADSQAADGQIDGVFLETVKPFPRARRHEPAVDTQMGKALARGPARELGI